MVSDIRYTELNLKALRVRGLPAIIYVLFEKRVFCREMKKEEFNLEKENSFLLSFLKSFYHKFFGYLQDFGYFLRR